MNISKVRVFALGVALILPIAVSSAFPDSPPDSNVQKSTGGVTVGGFVELKDVSYDIRLSLVESGAQNVPLPELEAKAARGEKLTDHEKTALKNLQQIKAR